MFQEGDNLFSKLIVDIKGIVSCVAFYLGEQEEQLSRAEETNE